MVWLQSRAFPFSHLLQREKKSVRRKHPRLSVLVSIILLLMWIRLNDSQPGCFYLHSFWHLFLQRRCGKKKVMTSKSQHLENKQEVGRLTVYSRIKVSSMIAGTQVTSNIPIAWFLVLGCNRQARVSSLIGSGGPNTSWQETKQWGSCEPANGSESDRWWFIHFLLENGMSG